MVFTDAPATEQSNQNTDTTAQESQQESSYLQRIVEAKGDNWKDPEVLAKGKLEADGYIKNLEDQLTQMREDLKKQEYKTEVLEQLQNKATENTAVSNGVPNNSNTETQNTSGTFSEEDLKSLVEKTLGQRELEAKVQSNLKLVDKELEGSFGTEARLKLKRKQQSLVCQ